MEPYVAKTITFTKESVSFDIVGVYALPHVQQWVFAALIECDNGDPFDALVEVASRSGGVVRTDTDMISYNENTCTWKMGKGRAIVYRVCGDEFTFFMQSVLYPPEYITFATAFPVGSWVCIARMGLHFGDVGCVVGHTNSLVHVITLIRAEKQSAEAPEARQALMRCTVGGLAGLPEEAIDANVGGIECWEKRLRESGQVLVLTKSGLRLIMYRPWELRCDLADGSPLSLEASQQELFKTALSPELMKRCPPAALARDYPLFLSGERVRLKDGDAVTTDAPPRRYTDDDVAIEVYVLRTRTCHYIAERWLVKEHTHPHAFDIDRLEKVWVLESDKLGTRIEIQALSLHSKPTVYSSS
jgi:hypothetical protein